MLLWPVIQGASTSGLSPSAAVLLINREKAVVVDIREKEAFAAGHLVGSRNLPVAELEAKLASTVKNKAVPLILVCDTGARTRRAEAIAKQLGYTQVQCLAGGLSAWRAASLPLEKQEA